MSTLNLIRAALTALVLIFAPATLAAQAPQEITQAVEQVDINTADAATIAVSLEGVGMVRAKEIVAYRTMFGNFKSIDELLEVPGIGAATLEKNRARIIISGD
ncbi:MAG: helix-hairpin-helix domain-containing protein [Pseudomonadales bacterium]|nr:helix-hairpin-helix domain-containing protein [Pseudomonadales bacterium]